MVKINKKQLEKLEIQIESATGNGNWNEVERIEDKLEVLYEVLNEAIIQGVNDPDLFK